MRARGYSRKRLLISFHVLCECIHLYVCETQNTTFKKTNKLHVSYISPGFCQTELMCPVNRSTVRRVFVESEKTYDCVLWTLLGEYEAPRLPAGFRSSLRAVFIFLVKVTLFLCGCLTLPSSFLVTNPCCILMNRILRTSKGVEHAHFCDHTILTLFFLLML